MNKSPEWLEHTEWITHADRVAPIVDGVEYFRAAREALIRARRQVILLGWDLHSEIDLLRGDEADEAEARDGYPVRLADLLERVRKDRPALRIHLLVWEGSPLFALERQHLPRMKRPWLDQERLELEWDRRTPVLASQHQKVVVVDDRLAFVGGMDLTHGRWDDHGHEPGDERRRKPGLIPSYGNPYHDLMLAVDGEAARVVGGWCRERWRRAVGRELEPPAECEFPDEDPWPPSVEPLLRDRRIAFARTQPRFEGYEEKRQVEQTYLAQIRAARRFVFIVNQYFSSGIICEALRERLVEEGGPEVVMILPYGCPGTLQSLSLDTQRDVLLDRLREADHEKRLAVYWPTLRGGSEEDVHNHAVYVHSKTMIVDDDVLRIGSANLANRSMGLDTELDAFVWAETEGDEAREAFGAFRHRLLAYLLGVEPDEVARAEASEPSLRATIEALRDGARTLHPFEHRAATIQGIALPIELGDPDRPLAAADAARAMSLLEASRSLSDRVGVFRSRLVAGIRHHRLEILFGTLLLGVALLWALPAVREQVDRDLVRASLDTVRGSRAGHAGVVVAFWIAAALGVPVTLMIATVAGLFGAASAVSISLVGVAGSASIGFALGRQMGGVGGDHLLAKRLHRLERRLRNRSVLTLALLRNVPIAPYALVNVACGMTPVRWSGFLLGTLIGMGPGIVLASVFGQELAAWFAEPTLFGVLRVAAVAASIVAAALLADRFLRPRIEQIGNDDPPSGSS